MLTDVSHLYNSDPRYALFVGFRVGFFSLKYIILNYAKAMHHMKGEI